MQYLTFNLNGVEYAVDVRIVESVVQHEGATAVPTPLAYMRGVMDLRGQVIPLIDLRRKLGLPEREDTAGTSVIVFTVAGAGNDGAKKSLIVGALVDGVSEVLTIDEALVETASGESMALWERFVSGIVRHEGRMIVIIEAKGLFSLEELDALRAA
jgi:purine-binding chemotaxis protein CheW